MADVHENADHVLATLRAAGIAYTAESYDAGGELLREYAGGPSHLALQPTQPAAADFVESNVARAGAPAELCR